MVTRAIQTLIPTCIRIRFLWGGRTHFGSGPPWGHTIEDFHRDRPTFGVSPPLCQQTKEESRFYHSAVTKPLVRLASLW